MKIESSDWAGLVVGGLWFVVAGTVIIAVAALMEKQPAKPEVPSHAFHILQNVIDGRPVTMSDFEVLQGIEGPSAVAEMAEKKHVSIDVVRGVLSEINLLVVADRVPDELRPAASQPAGNGVPKESKLPISSFLLED